MVLHGVGGKDVELCEAPRVLVDGEAAVVLLHARVVGPVLGLLDLNKQIDR